MPTEELTQTQRAPEAQERETRSFDEPQTDRQGHSASPYDGLMVSQIVGDDIKGSMQATGQVCRPIMVGVFLCCLGGVVTLLGLLLS